MAKTSTERNRELRARNKELGRKPYMVWITSEEKAIIKPMVTEKIKELRKEKKI